MRFFAFILSVLVAGGAFAAAVGLVDSTTQQPIPDADARYAGASHAAEHASGGADPVSLSAAQITSGELPDARVADTITAGQLAADPVACPGGQFVTDLSAAGVLTCATPPAGSSTTFDGGTYTEVTFGTNVTLVDDGDGTATVNVSAGTATLGDGDYGDVTVSGGGTVISIDLGVIGVSKLASADFGDFTCNGTTCTLDAAYLTTETDPVYSADPAAGITAQNIIDWTAAFGWGDHALAGYLTTVASADITDSSAAGRAILTAADAAAQRALLNVEDGAAADQIAAEVPVALNPTTYTAATADVEAHLTGINTALGSLGGGHDAVTVTDTTSVDLTLGGAGGQELSAAVIPGGLDALALQNAPAEAGATADQAAAEVPVSLSPTNYSAATPDVEAHLVGLNTALGALGGGHDAVTVTDSASVDLSLGGAGGQELTAAVIPGGIDALALLNAPAEAGATADQSAAEVPVSLSPANYTAATADAEANFVGVDDALGLRPLATDIAAGAITPAAGNLDLTGTNGQILVLDLVGNVVAGTLTDAAMTRVTTPTAGSVESWWRNPMAYDASIVAIWCESDQTVNLDVQVDDGTPADVVGTDIVCTSTPAATTVFGGDTIVSSGETLDIAITSVSGAPTWLSLQVVVEYQ